MHLLVVGHAKVGDDGNSEVGVVVRGDRVLWCIILLLIRGVLRACQEILALGNLLLWEILVQWTEEMDGALRAVVLGSWIELVAAQCNVEVGPESSILLYLLGHLEGSINLTTLAPVCHIECLFFHHKRLLRNGRQCRHTDR